MASKQITLHGNPTVDEQFTASAAITPGHLIENSTNQWRKHAGAGKNAAPWFALERDELGQEITVAYAANDEVKAGLFPVGSKVNALIASGQDLNVFDYLESAGDGTLRALATDAATDDTQRNAIVAMCAKDLGVVVVETRQPVWIV